MLIRHIQNVVDDLVVDLLLILNESELTVELLKELSLEWVGYYYQFVLIVYFWVETGVESFWILDFCEFLTELDGLNKFTIVNNSLRSEVAILKKVFWCGRDCELNRLIERLDLDFVTDLSQIELIKLSLFDVFPTPIIIYNHVRTQLFNWLLLVLLIKSIKLFNIVLSQMFSTTIE